MEGDPENKTPAETPVPLEYGFGETSEPGPARQTARAVSGALAGFALAVFVCFFVFEGVNSGAPWPRSRVEARRDHWVGAAFILLAAPVASLVARRFRRHAAGDAINWFSAGNLIGIGIALLIEGACFAMQ